MTRVVDILVPVALDQAYSYRVPAGLEIAPGDVVAVSLGARESLGVVWADNPKPNPRLHNRLKDIFARHGAAHGAAHGRTPRPRPRARRRAA
jgi:primosomal protein N'